MWVFYINQIDTPASRRPVRTASTASIPRPLPPTAETVLHRASTARWACWLDAVARILRVGLTRSFFVSAVAAWPGLLRWSDVRLAGDGSWLVKGVCRRIRPYKGEVPYRWVGDRGTYTCDGVVFFIAGHGTWPSPLHGLRRCHVCDRVHLALADCTRLSLSLTDTGLHV